MLILAWDRLGGLGPSERREIAVQKAVGWSTADVLYAKLYESVLVAFFACGDGDRDRLRVGLWGLGLGAAPHFGRVGGSLPHSAAHPGDRSRRSAGPGDDGVLPLRRGRVGTRVASVDPRPAERNARLNAHASWMRRIPLPGSHSGGGRETTAKTPRAPRVFMGQVSARAALAFWRFLLSVTIESVATGESLRRAGT